MGSLFHVDLEQSNKRSQKLLWKSSPAPCLFQLGKNLTGEIHISSFSVCFISTLFLLFHREQIY